MTAQDAALLASLTGFTPGPHIAVGQSVYSAHTSGPRAGQNRSSAHVDDPRTDCDELEATASLYAAAPDLHRIATEQAVEIERLRDVMGLIATHRQRCHDYDDDVGDERRGFDVEDVRIMEYAAAAALKVQVPDDYCAANDGIRPEDAT